MSLLPWYELEPPIGVGTVEAVGAVGTVGRTPTVGTVGLSDLWETVGDSGRAWYGGVTVGITVGHCRTLSGCRTVGLSDCRITVGSLSDFTVGLSDWGSGDFASMVAALHFRLLVKIVPLDLFFTMPARF